MTALTFPTIPTARGLSPDNAEIIADVIRRRWEATLAETRVALAMINANINNNHVNADAFLADTQCGLTDMIENMRAARNV